MMDHFIQINGKEFSFEDLARILGIEQAEDKSLDVFLCQKVDSGILRASLNGYDGDYPGIEVDLQLPEEKESLPVMISRTEQPCKESGEEKDDLTVRTFCYGRDDDYFMFFDADTRSDEDAEKHPIPPAITLSGNPDSSVEVSVENPYVEYKGYDYLSVTKQVEQQNEMLFQEQIAACRPTVSEQIHLLMESGHINSDQQVYADTHLDEITKQYLIRADAWEWENGRELPLSKEMEIMHEEIRKVAEEALGVKDPETPLHETALFREAVTYFNKEDQGRGLDLDQARAHPVELIFCYENKKDLLDFNSWTKYEALLGEKLTWDEYSVVDAMYGACHLETKSSDTQTIASMKADLESYRNKPKPLSAQIARAQDKVDQNSSRRQNTPQPEPTH